MSCLYVSNKLSRFWVLYSGRPPTISLGDISKSIPSPFELKINSLGSLECQIYASLVSLLLIGGKIMPSGKADVASDYTALMALDKELETWYSELPETIKWQPSNLTSAPMSLFHLQ